MGAEGSVVEWRARTCVSVGNLVEWRVRLGGWVCVRDLRSIAEWGSSRGMGRVVEWRIGCESIYERGHGECGMASEGGRSSAESTRIWVVSVIWDGGRGG